MNTLMMNAITATGTTWSLTDFLTNSGSTLQTWAIRLMLIFGVAALIVGIFMLVKGLVSKQAQTSWAKVIILILVGGLLIFGGWSGVTNLAAGGNKTIQDLGVQSKDGGSGEGAVIKPKTDTYLVDTTYLVTTPDGDSFEI